MRDHIGIDTLANWVSMLRADIDGAILLVDCEVEGQFYERCTHPAARVVPSPRAALPLLAMVQSRQISGVVAATSQFAPEKTLPSAVFQPDLGDIASLFVGSSCADRTIEEIGGAAWFKASSKDVGSLIDRLLALAWIIQNERPNAQEPLAVGGATKLVNWSTLEPTFAGALTNTYKISVQTIQERGRVNLLSECDGMITVELAAEATSEFRPRGLSANRNCAPGDFLSMMRLAFDLAELESDRLYWLMRGWERKNSRFSLLKPWRLLDPLHTVLDQRYWHSDLVVLLDSKYDNCMSVVKIDLDNFKLVNERLGHSAGDEAIKLAYTLVKEVFSGVGEVYRRGGDEIVVIAPGLAQDECSKLAECSRILIAEKFSAWGVQKGLSPTPTASIGIVYATAGCSAADVAACMDEAQSTAKQMGKNRVVSDACVSRPRTNHPTSEATAP